MNVDSIFNSPTTSLETLNTPKASSINEDALFIESGQLPCLHLLALQVLSTEEAPITKLLEKLNSPSIDFDTCKKEFCLAYLVSFNEFERDFFLEDFFKHFDPGADIVILEELSFEEKDHLWEGVIRYFCEQYLDFPSKAQKLNEVFKKIVPNKALTEEKLDQAFDQGLDFLLDYSKSSKRLIESKVLFMAYLARLISQLERLSHKCYEESSKALFENIDHLFEELYFYLLSMPYPVTLQVDSESLISLIQNEAIPEKSQGLQTKFVDQLLAFLKKQPSSQIDQKAETCLRETLRKYDFFKVY